MKIVFLKEELEIIKKAGISADVTKNLDNDMIFEIDEMVSDYLMYECIGEKDEVTEEGKICESILDKLAEE